MPPGIAPVFQIGVPPARPTAMERATCVAVAETAGPLVSASSSAFPELATIVRGEADSSGVPWHRYVAGALAELVDLAPGRGADIFIDGIAN